MISPSRAIVLIGCIACGGRAIMYMEPDLFVAITTLACSAALVLVTIVTAISGVAGRKVTRNWWQPPILGVAFVLLEYFSPAVGVSMADWRFKTQLNDYQRVVESIKDGTTVCSAVLSPIATRYKPVGVKSIWAASCPEGSLIVEFYVSTRLPLLHSGYLFMESERSNNCTDQAVTMERQRRPYQRRIIDNWYRCADQPGL
jgi:hypothetical protein